MVFVRINTDEGISGFGEAGVAYTSGTDAAFGMIKDFGKLIIGMNPMNIEEIWNKLHRTTFWGMGGGTIIFSGISAIDIGYFEIPDLPGIGQELTEDTIANAEVVSIK